MQVINGYDVERVANAFDASAQGWEPDETDTSTLAKLAVAVTISIILSFAGVKMLFDLEIKKTSMKMATRIPNALLPLLPKRQIGRIRYALEKTLGITCGAVAIAATAYAAPWDIDMVDATFFRGYEWKWQKHRKVLFRE